MLHMGLGQEERQREREKSREMPTNLRRIPSSPWAMI